MSRPKITWIGNPHKKELHRVEGGKKQPRGCQLSDGLVFQNGTAFVGHRWEFATAKAARALGFDPCVYCTVRFKSRH